MEQKKHIARVMVTVFVDGQRVEIPPGEPLPEGIPAHDLAQLKRLKAIEDLAETELADKAAAKNEKVARAEFEAEKKAVEAAQASTAAPEETTKAGGAKKAPAAKANT